jgi:hypothetical protein
VDNHSQQSDKQRTLEFYAMQYRLGLNQPFWMNMREDLEETAQSHRKQASIFLRNGDVESAKMQEWIATGIEESINRPKYVIDYTSGFVFDFCKACGRALTKIKEMVQR